MRTSAYQAEFSSGFRNRFISQPVPGWNRVSRRKLGPEVDVRISNLADGRCYRNNYAQ